MPSLRQLDLSGNLLTTLPPEIRLLTTKTLDLSGNQLTTLAPAQWELPELRVLDLRGNQLTSLPPELGQLQKLARLDLRGNPLTGCLPAGWRDQGIRVQFSEPLPFCTD